MKERPILFSAPMVRAILDGSKTQTRRIIKLPTVVAPRGDWAASTVGGSGITDSKGHVVPEQGCIWHTHTGTAITYSSQPGSYLWVRETCRAEELTTGEDGVRYLADNAWHPIENTQEAADRWIELNSYRGKTGATVPPIHMPRWASRILLEVTGVRVERLQDISDEDAVAEGTPCYVCGGKIDGLSEDDCHCFHRKATASDYRNLWGQINGAGSWEANPWVWIVEFCRIDALKRAA